VQNLDQDFVADTNVVFKLFVHEQESEKAAHLFEKAGQNRLRVIVPDFLPLEFLNILWFKTHRGELDHAGCVQISGLFRALLSTLRVVSCRSLLGQIIEASIAQDHRAYDMAFVVLAEHLSIPFVTADVKLYRKISRHFRSAVLLRDLKL
jgi:predicted nucleic acid-binding protein